MTEQYIEAAKTYIEDMKISRDAQAERLRKLEEYRGLFLRGKKRSSGKWYYCVHKSLSGIHKYLGDDDNDEVQKIKELRYLDIYIDRVDNNINLLQNTLKRMQCTDYDSINDLLPNTYKNPRLGSVSSENRAAIWKERAESIKQRHGIYRPQDLKVRVDDGNMVRSKSEGMIYNYLLSVGASFVYELPMVISGKTVVPDFTVLSEKANGTEIIIEHQGMMLDDSYRKRFSDKLYLYLSSGFVPGINIFLTFDDAEGEFDITPIKDAVRNHIKN